MRGRPCSRRLLRAKDCYLLSSSLPLNFRMPSVREIIGCIDSYGFLGRLTTLTLTLEERGMVQVLRWLQAALHWWLPRAFCDKRARRIALTREVEAGISSDYKATLNGGDGRVIIVAEGVGDNLLDGASRVGRWGDLGMVTVDSWRYWWGCNDHVWMSDIDAGFCKTWSKLAHLPWRHMTRGESPVCVKRTLACLG